MILAISLEKKIIDLVKLSSNIRNDFSHILGKKNIDLDQGVFIQLTLKAGDKIMS